MAERVFEQVAFDLRCKYQADPVEVGLIVYAYNHEAGAIAIQVPNEQVRKGLNVDGCTENGYVFFVEPVAADGVTLVVQDEDEGEPTLRLAKTRIKPEELKLHHHRVNWFFRVYKHGTAEPQVVRVNPKTRRMKDAAGYVIDAAVKSEMSACLVAVARFVKDHVEGYGNLYVMVAGQAPIPRTNLAERKPVTFDDLAKVRNGRPPVPDSDARRKVASTQARAQASANPNPSPPTPPPPSSGTAGESSTGCLCGGDRQTVPYTATYGNRSHSVHIPLDDALSLAEKIHAGSLVEVPEDPHMSDEVRYASYVTKDHVRELLFDRYPAGFILVKDLIHEASEGAIHPRHVDWLGTCNRLYGVIFELRQELEAEGNYTIETEARTQVSGRDADGTYVHSTTFGYRLAALTGHGVKNGLTNGVTA